MGVGNRCAHNKLVESRDVTSGQACAVSVQRLTQALCVDTATVEAKIDELQGLLNTDPIRVNAFFRKHLSPIVCTPIKENGQRFYRARGAGRGDELLTLLGLESPYDFRGCGGSIRSRFNPSVTIALTA